MKDGEEVCSQYCWCLAWRFGDGRDVIHVVAHGYEEVEEHLATKFHLILQSPEIVSVRFSSQGIDNIPAPLESVSASNDQGQVMGSQFGIILWRVVVGIASARQDRRALNTALQALLSKSQLL